MGQLLGRPRRAAALRGGIDRLDAAGELLADVEALGPLAVIPIEAVPVRPVARPEWRALGAMLLAAADVLLTVDHPVGAAGPTGQIRAACLPKRHAQSLHKPRSMA